MPTTSWNRASLTGLVLLAFSVCGCQHIDLFNRDSLLRLPKSSASNPVKEVICLWEPAEGTGLDGKPCRGVAGQVLFFATRNQEPVLINGTVEVYLFDDQGAATEQSTPLDTFKFTAEEWGTFLRQSKSLGAAYQLFVPYTRKGAHQAVCTMRVKYSPPDNVGIPIYSRMASVLLPGALPEQAVGAADKSRSQSASSIGHKRTTPERPDMEEYRQIARAVAEDKIGPSPVVHANAEQLQAGHQDDRERLKQRMQELLNGNVADPAPTRWKPETRSIRPQAIEATPAAVHHPLD